MVRTQLYSHNKTAYKAVMTAFESADRTCVVHPTGTGKSFLIAAVSEHYKRVLILGPNGFVLEQVHNVLAWRDKPGHNGNARMEYMTYALLMCKEQVPTGYDLIVLDEFHRAGAPEWGGAVVALLAANPQAKVFGTSATPIRYLDGERDMADELFHGNVASRITIAEAWNRNILPIPRYVSGLFRWDKTVGDATERINNSRSLPDKKKRERIFRLNNARLHWELAYGMPVILRKHLDRDARRVIVFCSGIESLEKMREEVVGWFREVGFTVTGTYLMHSDLPDREQREQMDRFEDDTDGKGVKLMFSVNMLNEGIHVPNVNAVLMLRTTASRIIYMQQMGRCLTAANTAKPLVLDMVDNITTTTAVKALKDEFDIIETQQAEHEHREPRKFEVADYTLGVKELIDKLVQDTIPYKERIAMATAFCEGHGRAPGIYDDKQEYRNWVRLSYIDAPEVIALKEQYGVQLGYERRIQMLQNFIKQQGRLPGKKDKKEYRNWVALCVKHKDKPEVVALKEQYRKRTDLEERLRMATAFCEQHNRVPGKKDDHKEYLNWKELSSKHKDRPEVQALSEQYKRRFSYEERLQRAMAFIERNGHPPRKSSDKGERANWKVLTTKHKDKPEVQALQQQFSPYVRFEERLKMATDFCRTHGRLPRKKERKDYFNWLYLRRYKDRPEVIALRERYRRDRRKETK